jgi:hypothetical protein
MSPGGAKEPEIVPDQNRFAEAIVPLKALTTQKPAPTNALRP